MPASSARSKSSAGHSRSTVRQSTSATRSSTTGWWSRTSRACGAVFVDELGDVPAGARVIFSAHGVAPSVFAEAESGLLDVIDATCPLVTKVHVEARSFSAKGYTVLLIGHREHVEVIGVIGEAPDATIVVSGPDEAEHVEVPDSERVAVLTQTTLSVDEAASTMAVLRRRFPCARDATQRGHLLRHNQSAGGREEAPHRGGPLAGDRGSDQLEQQPAA